MKIVTISKCSIFFKGMAYRAPVGDVQNAQDAILQWEILKRPKYTDIFQENEIVSEYEFKQNQKIRESNYSFLDKLINKHEKKKFIDYFKKTTGFPDVKQSSQKLIDEFLRVSSKAARENGSEVLLSGYDSLCSAGLGYALPGSDLDKSYIVVKGIPYGTLQDQENLSNRIKASIWNNIDNRLMSVNHCAAFPNVVTDKELNYAIDKLDKHANPLVDEETLNIFRLIQLEELDPIYGAIFNLALAKTLPMSERLYAKNFAYILETIRDGTKLVENRSYVQDLYSKMQHSPFCCLSNVSRAHAMKNQYMYSDALKPKLKAREELKYKFDKMPINEQYELVKDVIRSSSGDNKNSKFNKYFVATPDNRLILLNKILEGKIKF